MNAPSTVSGRRTARCASRPIPFSPALSLPITMCTRRPTVWQSRARRDSSRSSTAARDARNTAAAASITFWPPETSLSCAAPLSRGRWSSPRGTTTASPSRLIPPSHLTVCPAFCRTSTSAPARWRRSSSPTRSALSQDRRRAWSTSSLSSTPCPPASAAATLRLRCLNCCSF